MILKDVFEVFNYRIFGVSEYLWNCFGPNARWIDFEWEGAATGSGYSAGVVVDSKTQTVYIVEFHAYRPDQSDDLAYRWINPDYFDAYQQEASTRRVDTLVAYDEVKWRDFTDSDQFLSCVMEHVNHD